MNVTDGHGVVDDATPPFRFRLRTPIEIVDTDLGGIVYYGRYSVLADRGVVAYRRHLGIPALGVDGHSFVVRRMEVDYLSPARFEEAVDVWVRTPEIGRTSHVNEVAINDAETGQPRCRLRVVLVGVAGYEVSRPTRVPEDLAARLRAFEDGTGGG